MQFANSRNPLLVKDDIGKAKPTCYDLPDEDFAFGRPENTDLEGAKEVTMNWVDHKPNQKMESYVTNFVSVNKFAARQNVSLKAARQKMDQRKSSPPKGPRPIPQIYPHDVIPSFSYGKKTRPSTPIASVISNQFCAEYEAAAKVNYEQHRAEKRAAKKEREVHQTKCSVGHAAGAAKRRQELLTKEQGDQKEPFKMTKFKKVKAIVRLPDTYAEIAERQAAEGKAGAAKAQASKPTEEPKGEEPEVPAAE
eukprot:GEMP01061100.1.p1 GENE.GEMP01061100.1~~GEMP01061100.1.p1  ORF type:complete len:251 (+),score=68.87 GEMP01061100.1:101-853(+)